MSSIDAFLRPYARASWTLEACLARAGKLRPRRPQNPQTVFVWAFAALAVVSSGVAFGLLAQMKQLKIELAASGKELVATNGRLYDMERSLRRVSSAQAASEPPRKAAVEAPIVLSDGEVRLVHQFIKSAPSKTRSEPALKTGDEVAPSSSFPIPEKLAAQIAKLRDARFAFDQSGAIVIVGANTNRVTAVLVGPR